MMFIYFPLVSDFPPISQKIFGLRGKFPQIYLFPKMFRFSSSKISADLLFIHWLMATNFEFPPCLRCFSKFPPYFEKTILSFLLLQIFSPDFVNLRVLTYFMCFSFPPTLTMMHLCITQCTYWTPLGAASEN